MFEPLVALESRLDAAFPRSRLRGQAPPELVTRAREWSESVWHEAERLGPHPLTALEIAPGLDVARESDQPVTVLVDRAQHANEFALGCICEVGGHMV
jgi:hypothetical protein